MGKTVRILLFGMERSGKTTLVNSYKSGVFKPELRSTAHDSYDLTVDDTVNITIIEVGGRKEVRRFVEEYIPHTDAIIFVIDGTDENSFPEVVREFNRILNNPLTLNKPLAVAYNKIDISKIHPSIIIDQLGILHRYDRPHRVFSTTGKIPKSFEEILRWIVDTMGVDRFPLEDRVSRLLTIYIFDILAEKKQGFPLLSLLGQLQIMTQAGQVQYDRDKIVSLLRKLWEKGDLAYSEYTQLWSITDQGRARLNDPDLVKGTKYEKLRAILDEDKSSTSKEEKKEIIEEFDIDELAELYKKTSKK